MDGNKKVILYGTSSRKSHLCFGIIVNVLKQCFPNPHNLDDDKQASYQVLKQERHLCSGLALMGGAIRSSNPEKKKRPIFGKKTLFPWSTRDNHVRTYVTHDCCFAGKTKSCRLIPSFALHSVFSFVQSVSFLGQLHRGVHRIWGPSHTPKYR